MLLVVLLVLELVLLRELVEVDVIVLDAIETWEELLTTRDADVADVTTGLSDEDLGATLVGRDAILP